ncbi:GNAT family N-acetyltransferase [Bosea sp. 2KB_26]|uniref:GNAT family N-acetyltransferase n=1 Tax=Bosea sp. 2KB_26 TaxID=3237475 RepID=UPI003F8DCB61
MIPAALNQRCVQMQPAASAGFSIGQQEARLPRWVESSWFFLHFGGRAEEIRLQMETARLLLRPSRLSDAPSLFEFLGNKGAMQHTHVDETVLDCRRRIAVHEWRRRREGYAPWTVIEKTSGKLIGWGGLYDDPFDPGWGCEVGYWFHPSAWGNGYASELVWAALRMADNQLKLPEVRAFAHPENAGSRKVLEKAGFEVVRFVPEMNRLLFSRQRQQNGMVA